MGYSEDYKQDAEEELREDSRLALFEEEGIEEHECLSCGNWFESGEGVKIEDEVFCHKCVAENRHYDFYRNHCGLDDSEIYEYTQSITQL
jgi:Zn ribbon nucleic-acid-binding protein